MLFFFNFSDPENLHPKRKPHRVHHVQDRETQDAPGTGRGRFIKSWRFIKVTVNIHEKHQPINSYIWQVPAFINQMP